MFAVTMSNPITTQQQSASNKHQKMMQRQLLQLAALDGGYTSDTSTGTAES